MAQKEKTRLQIRWILFNSNLNISLCVHTKCSVYKNVLYIQKYSFIKEKRNALWMAGIYCWHRSVLVRQTLKQGTATDGEKPSVREFGAHFLKYFVTHSLVQEMPNRDLQQRHYVGTRFFCEYIQYMASFCLQKSNTKLRDIWTDLAFYMLFFFLHLSDVCSGDDRPTFSCKPKNIQNCRRLWHLLVVKTRLPAHTFFNYIEHCPKGPPIPSRKHPTAKRDSEWHCTLRDYLLY